MSRSFGSLTLKYSYPPCWYLSYIKSVPRARKLEYKFIANIATSPFDFLPQTNSRHAENSEGRVIISSKVGMLFLFFFIYNRQNDYDKQTAQHKLKSIGSLCRLATQNETYSQIASLFHGYTNRDDTSNDDRINRYTFFSLSQKVEEVGKMLYGWKNQIKKQNHQFK